MLTSIYETVIEESGEQTEGKLTNFPGAVCVCVCHFTGNPNYRFSLALIYSQ